MLGTDALFVFVRLWDNGQQQASARNERPKQKGNLMDNELLYTPEELAAKLKITENALGIWRHNGTGPRYIRISRRAIRYSDLAIQEWLQEKEIA